MWLLPSHHGGAESACSTPWHVLWSLNGTVRPSCPLLALWTLIGRVGDCNLSGANFVQTYVCLANLRPLIGFWQGVARCDFFGGTRSHNLLLYSIMRSGPVGKADNCGCREMSEVVGLADLVVHLCKARSACDQGGHASSACCRMLCSAVRVVGQRPCAEPAFRVALFQAAAGILACPCVRLRKGMSQSAICSCTTLCLVKASCCCTAVLRKQAA